MIVFKDEKPVALLPANRVGNTVYSHQGLSYGGLIVHKEAKFNDVYHYFKVVLNFLQQEEVLLLELKLIPSIYTALASNEIDYLMFKLKAQLKRRDILSVIDLRNNQITRSQNRRRGLKRAHQSNLKIEEETNFDQFWNQILIPNLRDTHGVTPVHSVDEITLLRSRFPNNIRQFNVYSNTTIVGGTTIFETDEVAHAQYISANENRQELGTLDFLFDEIITNVFRDKTFFDFGTSNVNNGEQINEGLLAWKESFGARSMVQDFYTVATKNVNMLNDLML